MGNAQTYSGALSLEVTEKGSGTPIPFANVALYQDSAIVTGAATDFDGKAEIKPIPAGKYDIQISSLGFSSIKITGVQISARKTTFIPKIQCMMSANSVELSELVVMNYCVPIIERDASAVAHYITSHEIRHMSRRERRSLASTVGGTYSKDNGKSRLNVRGSRASANYYFIDGIKVRANTSLPRFAIERMSSTSSTESIEDRMNGLPARYKDYENLDFQNPLTPEQSTIRVKYYDPPVISEDNSNAFDRLFEDYEYYSENEFKSTKSEELSTFSIDVDQGSYTNVRRIINSGYLPPLSSVRLEEFINYFPYEKAEKDDEHPFIVDTEMGNCPWNQNHQLLKVTLQGDEIQFDEAPKSNLVFLLDVSGSMSSEDKLPLIQRAFNLLVDQLRDHDRVSIVVYAGSSGVVLEGAKGSHKSEIKKAINNLHAGGSTAGGEGILLAYKIAEKNFIKGGNNRVILATDGDFNVGISDDKQLVQLIEKKREGGVYFTTIGCGTGNYKDSKLEKLADHGNGSYSYIDTYKEARKVFMKELTGTIFTVAKDVKFQIEFNPSKVSSYRLLGYENRVLADRDFDDDSKDAGELGAGQMVTAFYELVPPGVYNSAKIIKKRYKRITINAMANSDELLNLKIRYKLPDQKKSILIERPVTLVKSENEELSESFRFGSSVVEFGLVLRDSKYKGKSNLASAMKRAEDAVTYDPEGYRREFLSLVEMCSEMYASAD